MAVVMTSCIDAVLIFLACGAIGAIFSSTSPDMGEVGIVQRYSQVQPKVLLVDSIVVYNRKVLDLRERMRSIAVALKESSGLQTLVVCQGAQVDVAGVQSLSVSEFLADAKRSPLYFEQVSFDHPIYILYSSGTTGPPKCMLHSGGAALMQQKKELMLSFSLGANDCFYQYTTTGWMMWTYAVVALSCGARLILYDGSPMVPDCSKQLEIIENQRVSVWGTSPKFLSALRRECPYKLPASLKLDSLQALSSAGAPLLSEVADWFYEVFPKRIPLFNGSGGTDVLGGIVMGTPLLPIYAGEIQGCALGMKVEIFNREGRNIDGSEEPGDMVISKPFPSMPVGFWGPDGEKKFFAAYFMEYPGVWCHGDYLRKNPATGGYDVLGRSDGVLNPGGNYSYNTVKYDIKTANEGKGVRFGSAELYNVVERFREQVVDSLVVGRRRAKDTDEAVMMFLKLKPGLMLQQSLLISIKNAIRTSLSARHVPRFIFQVKDIPYTSNGKKVENAVKSIVSGQKTVTGLVINSECLDEYYKFMDIEEPTNSMKTKLLAKI